MQPKTHEQLATSSPNETVRIGIHDMLKHAMEIRVSDVEQSITITKKVADQCNEIEYPWGIATSRCQLGLFYMIVGKNEEALSYAESALDLFEEQKDKAGMAESLYTMGSVHYKSSNHHIGLEYLYRSLRLQQDIEDLPGQSRTLKAIGFIYESFAERDRAMETYLECRKISQSIGDKNGESNACNTLSGLYLRKQDYENAFETINLSIAYKQETGDLRGLAFALYGKGKVHLKLKEYQEAQVIFEESLRIHVKVGEGLGNGLCQVKLGKLHFERGELEKAKEYLINAVEVGEGMSNDFIKFKAYYILYQIAEEENDLKHALRYHIEFHKNRENIINSESRTKLKSLEAMWRMESLEAEAKSQKEKNDLIEKKNAELDKFASRVSHDLRGPISSLLGLYDVVKDEVTDGKSIEYFDMYHSRIKRLNQTIVDILELSKVKEWQLSKTLIDFEQIIKECLDSFDYLPNYKNVDVRINIEPGLTVKSDRVLLNTILQNLIENGIKYSKPNDPEAYLSVLLQTKASTLHIIVEDNGIGINEKYQSKVFDMFYRAHDKIPGSGLGMYILKNAVVKLNGTVNLESTLGEGTRFEVQIPMND